MSLYAEKCVETETSSLKQHEEQTMRQTIAVIFQVLEVSVAMFHV